MSAAGQRETLTQQRVVEFFQDALGYAYLGDWLAQLSAAGVK